MKDTVTIYKDPINGMSAEFIGWCMDIVDGKINFSPRKWYPDMTRYQRDLLYQVVLEIHMDYLEGHIVKREFVETQVPRTPEMGHTTYSIQWNPCLHVVRMGDDFEQKIDWRY